MQMNLKQGSFSGAPVFVPAQHGGAASPHIDQAVTYNELAAMQQAARGATSPSILPGAIPLNTVAAAAAAASAQASSSHTQTGQVAAGSDFVAQNREDNMTLIAMLISLVANWTTPQLSAHLMKG